MKNKRLIKTGYVIGSICLGILIGVSVHLTKAWVEPDQMPPGGNIAAPLNTGNVGQSKGGGLILNTLGAIYGLIVDKGNTGLGTRTPTEKLEVCGNIKLCGETRRITNLSSPIESSDAASKGYVDGKDAQVKNYIDQKIAELKAYIDSKIGGGIPSCPSGFTMIGEAGKRGNFCIDTNQRAAQNQYDAILTCNNLSLIEGEASLCEYKEWYVACKSGKAIDMVGDWERVSEYNTYGGGHVAGKDNCQSFTAYNIASRTTPVPFRCCIR